MGDERKNIDEITRTLASLTGLERLVGRDDTGDFKFLISTLVETVLNEVSPDPVGTVKFWHKTMPNTPALAAGSIYKEMDGSLISDGDSPYDGYRIPNENGDDVVLTLTWASGVATASSTDVTALAVGDAVSGSTIAALSTITDITGSVVTISDTSFSGSSVSTTFTNDGRFNRGGGSSGDGQLDATQKTTGSINSYIRGGAAGDYIDLFKDATGVFDKVAHDGTGAGSATNTDTNLGYGLKFDSSANGKYKTDGTGTGDGENRPINTSMVKIMKIKA